MIFAAKKMVAAQGFNYAKSTGSRAAGLTGTLGGKRQRHANMDCANSQVAIAAMQEHARTLPALREQAAASMQTLVDTSVAARFDGLLDVLESGLQQQHQEQLLQMVKQQQELQQVQSQQQLLQAQAQQQALLQQQMQYIASRGKRDSPTTDVREPSDSRTAAATATAAAVHENGRFDVSYDDDTLDRRWSTT